MEGAIHTVLVYVCLPQLPVKILGDGDPEHASLGRQSVVGRQVHNGVARVCPGQHSDRFVMTTKTGHAGEGSEGTFWQKFVNGSLEGICF